MDGKRRSQAGVLKQGAPGPGAASQGAPSQDGRPGKAPDSARPAPGGNGAPPPVSAPAQDPRDLLTRAYRPREARRTIGPGMSADDLLSALLDEPWAFDFFQAVRRLECAYARMPRIGSSAWSSEDAVRFCQEPSLAFASSTVPGA